MAEPVRQVVAFLGSGPTLIEVPVTTVFRFDQSCGDDPPRS
jgi:hypothetical protein